MNYLVQFPNLFVSSIRIALAFGVTVATMAQSIGHVSGCHINPAVTAGLLVGRKIGLLRALFYIVFQCLGGVLGAGLLLVLFNKISDCYQDIKLIQNNFLQILTPTEFQGAAGLGKTALGAGVSPGQVSIYIKNIYSFISIQTN